MWEEIEFDPEKIPIIKLGLHIAQIVFAFVLWALEIAVFRDADSTINGNNGWTFGACFLSIPAWIYLTMAPRFPRTRKIAEPHAMLVVDVVFTVVWLSAFATQAAYNTANSCGGACKLSKAIVGLGFFVFFFFALTTFLSIYTLKYYQWNNRLPGYDRLGGGSTQNIDPDKAAFSLAPHDEESVYAPVNMSDRDRDPYNDDDNDTRIGGGGSDYTHVTDPYGAPSSVGASTVDPYGGGGASTVLGGNSMNSRYGGASVVSENPFRQDDPFDNHTEYGGAHSDVGGNRYAPPSVAMDDPYGDNDRTSAARFPSGAYDRIER